MKVNIGDYKKDVKITGWNLFLYGEGMQRDIILFIQNLKGFNITRYDDAEKIFDKIKKGEKQIITIYCEDNIQELRDFGFEFEVENIEPILEDKKRIMVKSIMWTCSCGLEHEEVFNKGNINTIFRCKCGEYIMLDYYITIVNGNIYNEEKCKSCKYHNSCGKEEDFDLECIYENK